MEWTQFALVALSIALLAYGADSLVVGAASIAARLRISPLVIGVTVVGFGTSFPEFFASLSAALQGQNGIAVGNVVGSNIFNIAVVLGASALVSPIAVADPGIRRELFVALAAAIVPWVALAFGGTIVRWVGAAMVLVLVAHVWLTLRRGLAAAPAADPAATAQMQSMTKAVLRIVLGLVLMYFGVELLIDAALALGRAFGVSELVLGLTVVAGGTSLPELVSSLIAARRGHAEVAIGNVLGSNIFNVFGVLGATSLVEPQRLLPQIVWLDVPVMLAASLVLIPLVLVQRRIGRVAGASLLVGYLAYLLVLLFAAPAWFPPG